MYCSTDNNTTFSHVINRTKNSASSIQKHISLYLPKQTEHLLLKASYQFPKINKYCTCSLETGLQKINPQIKNLLWNRQGDSDKSQNTLPTNTEVSKGWKVQERLKQLLCIFLLQYWNLKKKEWTYKLKLAYNSHSFT